MIVVAVTENPAMMTVIISKTTYAARAVKNCFDKRHELVKYKRKNMSRGTSKKLLERARFLLHGTDESIIPEVIRL